MADAVLQAQTGRSQRYHTHRRKRITAGLLTKLTNQPGRIRTHQTKALGRSGINRQRRHRESGTTGPMRSHESAIVHAVELITREDQDLIDIPGLKQLAVLAHRIGRALEPTGAIRCLLSRQHLNKATAEPRREVVGQAEMTVQRLTVELGQCIDLVNP